MCLSIDGERQLQFLLNRAGKAGYVAINIADVLLQP